MAVKIHSADVFGFTTSLYYDRNGGVSRQLYPFTSEIPKSSSRGMANGSHNNISDNDDICGGECVGS